jgi:DMSO/TMAO reductase YedYZ molybdopterin-dependent catalytic subunit
MGFFFPAAHYWAAWITMGALVVHVAAKLPVTRRALGRGVGATEPDGDGLDRRGFLTTVAAAAGVLVLATAGQTIGPLRRLSVLAPRRPDIGPQGYPVNTAAAAARLDERDLRSQEYRVDVEGAVDRPLALSLEDLRAMPQHEATLPIACVEGWSFSARWRGVRVRDLLAMAGAADGAEARVESAQPGSRYRTSPLNTDQAADPDTLLALELDGEPLAIEHGFPIRLIGPNRPGVHQTKWVTKVVVL